LESTTEAPTYTKEILSQLKESTPNTPPSFTEDALVAEKFPSTIGTGVPNDFQVVSQLGLCKTLYIYYTTIHITYGIFGVFIGPITGIPDPATIHAAKKKREMLRQRVAGGAPEYISLSDETDVGLMFNCVKAISCYIY